MNRPSDKVQGSEQMSTEMEQQQWTKLHPQKQPTKPAMKQHGLLNNHDGTQGYMKIFHPPKGMFLVNRGQPKKTTNHGNCAIYFYPGVS